MRHVSIARALSTAVVAALIGIASPVPGANAESRTHCSSAYLADKVVGFAKTAKSSRIVSGSTGAIDDWTSCDLNSMWDADNVIDTYKGGVVYKYASGSYSQCIVKVGGWRGYWSTSNYTWSLDLDNFSGKCGWASNPIKVRHTAKAEWVDGTVKTINVYVTDSSL